MFTFQETKTAQSMRRKAVTMKLKMFSIRDAKAEIFHSPYFNKSHGEAERNFAELVKDEKSMIHKYPQDFDLYFLGEYDDQTGKMEALDTPQHVAKAVTVQTTNPVT